MESILIISALVVIALYFFHKKISPRLIGAIGERKVASKLRRLSKGDYIVLNNLLFKNGEHSSQIDHVVIAKSGIFVIETKNYKGWINGHELSEYWTQKLYDRTNKLRNPIKQNWAHVYALKKVLTKHGQIKYFPIVVFAGDASLKKVNTELPVIYAKKLRKTIKKLNREDKLSATQMEQIADTLRENNISDRKAIKQHTKQVKKQVRERERAIRKKRCPKCGSKLVKKRGKYGKFYGCEQFPQCRFTYINK